MDNNELFDYNGEKAWYCIKTQNRREEDVKEALDQRRETMQIEDKLLRTFIPYTITETKKGDKLVEVKKKICPGYVFVEMYMTDDAWYVVRNTKYVHGFVGSHGHGSKPTPVKEADISKLLLASDELPKYTGDIKEGQSVIITNGPFCGYKGIVKLIKKDSAIIPINFMDREVDAEVELVFLKGEEENGNED